MGPNTDRPGALRGYAFGSFSLDPVRRLLYRGSDVVPITAKTFDVLLILVANRERIVSKDELLRTAWPDVVVQDNNLVRQISMLRRLLGERPDAHEFIVTVTGQGYRFVAPVVEMGRSAPDPSAEDVAVDGAPPVVASRFTRSSGWLRLALAVVVLLAGALGVLRLRGASSESWTIRPLTQVTYDATLPRSPAWAPDGQSFAFVSDRAGSPDIWTQRLDDPNPVQLTSDAAIDAEPDWSPDARQVVFRSERGGGGLYVIPADGGAPRLVAGFGREPRWSPDGRHILFRRETPAIGGRPDYFVLDVRDSGVPRPLRPDALRAFTSGSAAWRPDGRVSVWGTHANGGRRFVTLSVDGTDTSAATMTDDVARAIGVLTPGRFLWAPDQRFVVFEAEAGGTGDIWKVTVDPDTDRWVDGPERLTTGVGGDSGVALSADGTRLLYGDYSTRARLWAFPFDEAAGRIDGEPIPVTSGGVGEIDADTPRDGSKIAYRAERAGRFELWERTMADGSERLLLSTGEWRHTTPRWSPDGARVAYSRLGKDSMQVVDVAMLSAGGSEERALTRPGDMEFLPWDWTPDATAILGACRIDDMPRFGTCLMRVPRDGQVSRSAVTVLAADPRLDLFNQELSPDQRWISFMAIDPGSTGTTTVYVVPAGGGDWISVTDGSAFDDKPSWSRDGRSVYFVSDREGMPNVWFREWDSDAGRPVGDPRAVTAFQSPRFRLSPRTASMDIELTDRSLLLPISESIGQVWMLEGVDR